jgi:hypothetical protein
VRAAMPSKKRKKLIPRKRDERGVALMVSLLVVLMVTMVGVTAMYTMLNSNYSGHVTSKHVQVETAGEAGNSAAIAAIDSAVNTDNTLIQDGTGTAVPLTCTSTSSSTSFNGNAAGSGDAADPASKGWYSLEYATSGTSAASAEAALGTSVTTGWTAGSCATTGTTIMTEPLYATQTSEWWIAIESTGATSSGVYNTAHPTISVLAITPIYKPSTAFDEDLFGNISITSSGSVAETGSVYSPSALECNTSTTYDGNVWVGAGTSSGSCTIDGNLYVIGSVVFANSTTVTGTVYATGSVSATTGTIKLGNIVADGTVTFPSKATTTISGSIWSEGSITVANGTVGGSQSPSTPWTTVPSCSFPATCVSTGLTFSANPTFPSVTYTAADWTGYAIIDDTDACLSSGYAPASVYTDIQDATTPTVVETSCAVEFDGSSQGEMTMSTTVAVFADGGFYVDDTTSPAVDGDGNLYLIVPSTVPPNSDTTPLSSCPTQSGGKKSPASPAGDIWLQGNIVNTGSNVGTLLYTPDNICTASNPSFTGQVYAGQNFYSSTGWTFTADNSVSLDSPFTGSSSSNDGATASLVTIY